ncbi:DUF58 domain-containing protein [Roseibacterium sp. KMU-115]|uniref:DUF58 domain-containing protein n=2 Tax=Roseicyclus persicicus TaxID=2650661 RepID=A0A7X6JXL5_9RHOB|nr:DUF58 domain-containing protein [Roseibacterium persicicum]
MADAQHLSATVLLGVHGRKRAGTGDEFWQYRPAQAGDAYRQIDWRRSARSDGHFIRQTEWQAAQAVLIGVDDAASMTFTGHKGRPSKLRRAQTLAMALAIIAVRGGERVGLTHLPEPPRGGTAQLMRMAQALMDGHEAGDYGAPRPQVMPMGSRAVFLSDFLGDPAAIEAVLGRAADRDVRGALVQILDPDEEAFPFDGRTVFESMTGAIRFETLKAKSLREAYLERLAERKARLQEMCRRTGWRYHLHHTDQPAEPALLWLYRALEKVRA